MSDEQKREEELGALWIKTGPRGEFMTGSVTIGGEKTDITVFPNTYKTKDNQPSFRILKSRQKGEPHTYAPSTRRDERQHQPPLDMDSATRPQTRSKPRQATGPAPDDDWTDEVPFP